MSCALLALAAGPSGAAVPSPCPNEAFRTGPSSELPDCRAYEMVSPLDKNGGDIRALPPIVSGIYASHKQSSFDGEKVTFTSSTAFGDTISGLWANQYLASRTETGWSTHSISPPRGTALFEGQGTLPVLNWDTENFFEAFTADLCHAWLKDTNVQPLTPDGLQGYGNLYRRSNCGPEGYEALSNQGPGPATPYLNGAGEWGAEVEATGPGLRFQGASNDLSHQVFVSGAPLLPDEVGFEAKCSTTTFAETISYRWLRNGVPIEGATSPTYTITPADAGTAIQCQIFAFNTNGGSTQAATKARVIAPVPGTPVPVAPDTISATSSAALKVGEPGGQTLECDPQADEWRYSPTFTYQWYRNGVAIAGADASTYTVTEKDLESAAFFQCAVTGTNAGGSVVKVSANSSCSAPRQPCTRQPSIPNAPAANASLNKTRLYDLHNGELELVGILDDGRPNPENSVAGMLGNSAVTRESLLDHAVSEDGRRIFWTSRTGFDASGPGQIYVRVNGEKTIPVSETAETLSGENESLFWTAAADGSAVLFSTADFGIADLAHSADFYEFDVDSKATRLIASQSPGLLGASDDLSRIYFVSTKKLTDDAVEGEWNLYLEQDRVTRLVTILSADDKEVHISGISPIRPAPTARASRVTADGRHIAFQAMGSLTGYDNFNPATGKRYSEVYHYDADNDKLTCVSCNPSGEPPTGPPILTPYNAFDKPLNEGAFFEEKYAQAATLPTWERDFHASRVLSEDGNRVFFQSHEALAARDTNGAIKDVYQWEAQGTGSCEQAGGCVDLISTGTSAQGSEFVDASADGDDVFFSTTSRIDPRDEGSIDIYDARVGGGFPIPPVSPQCIGDACRSIPESPRRQTPTSAIFTGPEGSSSKSCRALSRRAAKLARRARRTGSQKLAKRAKRVGKRAKRCRRSNRGGAR